MSLQSHLVELEKRHSDLERELEEAMRHPSMDSLEIASLKRCKHHLSPYSHPRYHPLVVSSTPERYCFFSDTHDI